MNQTKQGLVFGGGGSRGSYEVGVCKALDELGYTFDYVTGTSIGAICGAMYVQNNIDGLTSWISSFKQDEVAKNLFLFPEQYTIEPQSGQDINAFLAQYSKNGPSIEPLRQRLSQIFSYDKFMASRIEYACLTYNLTQNHPEAFYRKDMNEEDCLDKILASTAYFPAFNFLKIGDNYYLDGSYANTVPIELCKSMGAEHIYAIMLADPGKPEPEGVDSTVFLQRPLLKLKYFLDFRGDELEKQVSQGYLETLKYLNKAPGYLYTFYPEDWDHMVHIEELCMGFLVKEGKVEVLEDMKPVMDEIYMFLFDYIPQPLKNQYSDRYIFGRLLEVMGVIAGIDLYKQIHFKDFIRELLKRFSEFDSNPNLVPAPAMYEAMEKKGLKDLLVFFHTALKSYNHHLPDSFKAVEKKFMLPYYLAWGWYLIEKLQLVFYL